MEEVRGGQMKVRGGQTKVREGQGRGQRRSEEGQRKSYEGQMKVRQGQGRGQRRSALLVLLPLTKATGSLLLVPTMLRLSTTVFFIRASAYDLRVLTGMFCWDRRAMAINWTEPDLAK